ncbi:hypothetical protein F2P56_035772 [Juglans regia]|uniref:Uncharacterized protein LOC108987117 n=2 Tax=Juglans regia TaxID=51240 RepID=A0A2I4E803_JUGRE|nr:uncharacterized protein LOC108987117 [Juglans regia]KAF5443193.1 hypothetical protein F2P56_035772 [Juglans regia]
MVSHGAIRPPCNSTPFLALHRTTTTLLSFPTKTQLSLVSNTCSSSSLYSVFCGNHSFIFSLPQPHLYSRVICERRHFGLGGRALSDRGKVGIGLPEMDGFDDVEEEDEFDDDNVDEEEDDEVLVPFENMRQWLKNKPCGFGDGKMYDTSVEDKLLEEMEQSKQAQATNVMKLKNDPIKPNSMKDAQKNIAPEVVPSGVRVRVVNLPKKRNIDRDLKSAFRGTLGLLNIIPAVSGNRKTRDPVCKGFAFVDFRSEEDARRFVQIFSSQSIMFGKIEKQIKCDIMNPRSPSSSHVQSTAISNSASELRVPDFEGYQTDSNVDDSSLDSWEEITSDESDNPDNKLIGANVGDIREDLKSISAVKLNSVDSMEARTDPLAHSFSSKIERIPAPEKQLLAQGKREKVSEKKLHVKAKGEKAPAKKPVGKEKREKVPKLAIPGSAKRLKIKEKAVLTDVFSKYGAQAAFASKEGS